VERRQWSFKLEEEVNPGDSDDVYWGEGKQTEKRTQNAFNACKVCAIPINDKQLKAITAN
jgi:hypothetical protein